MWAMLQAPPTATPRSKKARPSPEESRPLAAGSRVVLRGLKGSSEHTGTYALVRSFDNAISKPLLRRRRARGGQGRGPAKFPLSLNACTKLTLAKARIYGTKSLPTSMCTRELLGANLEEGACNGAGPRGGDKQRIAI